MKIRNHKLIRVLARILAWGLRLWFRPVRLHLVGEVPGMDPYGDAGERRYLYCLWHDAIVGVIFSRPHTRMAGLVSLHADGAWVADVMEVFGIRPIRGSSSRRGAAAVREMCTAARDWHIAITVDGPRGPRHRVKDGILYIASQTGRPIVPTAFVASREFRPRGRWTDMCIPWPWAHTWLVACAPLHVPPGLRPDQLAPYRDQLQQAMDDVNAFAEAIARGEAEGFYPGWREALAGDVSRRAA